MIVVLDTNVFVYDTHMLGKEIGQQLLKLLEARQGQVFIPEILRKEYLEQARAVATEYQKKLADKARDLRTLLGHEVNHNALSDAAIDKAAQERIRSLESITRPGPSMDDLAHVSGRRVVAKKSPVTKTDHGYKDCMIWEAILTLPAGSVVWLISRDGGFYDDRAFLRDLEQEAQERNIIVRGCKNLEPLLQELRTHTPELDQAASDVAERTQNPPAAEPGGLIPPVEPSYPREGAAAVTGQELEIALGRVRETFQETDVRVLGFIAYLEMASKDQIFGLLSQAGIETELAKNSAQRLALGGAIRDTGTHYIVEDRTLAVVAASRVEDEIINLLNEGGQVGH